jgi:hypothetical protein
VEWKKEKGEMRSVVEKNENKNRKKCENLRPYLREK